jgi:hypothetical protein
MTQMSQENTQPDPQFAMVAMQEEIARLRGLVIQADDSRVYLNALLHQMRAEARTEIGRLVAEISLLKSEDAPADPAE